MGIAAEDHLAATGEVLAHELVDDGDVGRYVYATVLLGRREPEEVIVVVDRAAHGAQRVMAAGEHVGQGKAFHTRRARGLDDANVGDVVACHRVEFDSEVLEVIRDGVRCEDGMRDRALARMLALCWRDAHLIQTLRLVFRDELRSIDEIYAFCSEPYHKSSFRYDKFE